MWWIQVEKRHVYMIRKLVHLNLKLIGYQKHQHHNGLVDVAAQDLAIAIVCTLPPWYDNFQQQLAPEILSRPIEDLILNMKSMFINNIETFPFPTPPNQDEIQHAISSLQCLGAITPSINNASDQIQVTACR